MRWLLVLAGAVAVGALVWLSVAAQFFELARAAWWAPLVALSFPALMAALVWRDR